MGKGKAELPPAGGGQRKEASEASSSSGEIQDFEDQSDRI